MPYEATSEQLKDHFKDALADAEALVKATAEVSGERVSELRLKATESLRLARIRLEATQDAFILKARGAANATDTYVRESPWEAIGVAGAVGILVGVILARR